MSAVASFDERLASTSAQIARQRASDRADCWAMLEQLAGVLLAGTHSTDWLDTRALARTARSHRVLWGKLLLDNRRMQEELRRFFDVCGIVSIGNVDVERVEEPIGRRSVMKVQFRRRFAGEELARSIARDNETTELDQAA